MTDQNDLDGFLASAGIPAEAETVTETVATPQTEPNPAVNRDEQGRFAPKANEAEPTATVDPVTPAPAAEPTTGHVPLAALHAEREKSKETARQLQQAMAMLQALQQRPHPAQPQPKAKDFWEDPNGFVASQVEPVQQLVQQGTLRTSKMLAVQAHGREKVQEAYEALGSALNTDPQARFAYQQIMASDHPYDEMVSWHRRQQAMARVGSDPDAFIEAEIAKRMSDPAFQAKVIEQARGTATGQSPTQPLTTVPPSLARIPTGGNAAVEPDMSSQGLFNYAMASR